MTEKKNYHIILLDDDRFLLDMYSLKFTQEGYTVQSCLAVQEVVDALKGGFPADAVVFDLVMPVKDGFDLLRAIHDEGLAKNAVLVALTNQGADEERRKTEELGAHEYIVKATTIPSEVVNTITTAIQRHLRA
ncbi:MAG: response regulator [Candidatus Pacebacteria bacterium]|nr:response regulator [Candidatus Paceibacterota bacterium]